jgi:hypothetical protein
MFKTGAFGTTANVLYYRLGHLDLGSFDIVSNFEFRYSYFDVHPKELYQVPLRALSTSLPLPEVNDY